jgi:hypothetical protein
LKHQDETDNKDINYSNIINTRFVDVVKSILCFDPNEQSTFFKEDELIEYNEFENSSTTVTNPTLGLCLGLGLGLTGRVLHLRLRLNPRIIRGDRQEHFFDKNTMDDPFRHIPEFVRARQTVRVQRLHGQPHIQAAVELERVQQDEEARRRSRWIRPTRFIC